MTQLSRSIAKNNGLTGVLRLALHVLFTLGVSQPRSGSKNLNSQEKTQMKSSLSLALVAYTGKVIAIIVGS